TTTNQARKRSPDIDFVAFCCQLVSRRLRKAALHCHVAAAEAAFGEPRRFERGLNIHFEVNDISDKLRMRLRLIPPTHDAKRHSRVPMLHERWNDGMQRPFASRQGIWRCGIEIEQRTTVVQNESGAGGHDTGTKRLEVALNQRDHISVPIHYAEVR